MNLKYKNHLRFRAPFFALRATQGKQDSRFRVQDLSNAEFGMRKFKKQKPKTKH